MISQLKYVEDVVGISLGYQQITPQSPFEILLIEKVMDSLDEAFALFTYPIKRRHWTES
jgi:hypothetical protein